MTNQYILSIKKSTCSNCLSKKKNYAIDLPPPPIGFRADFLESPTGNNSLPYPSGIQLSYPIATPGTPPHIMPMPYSPLFLSQPPFQDEVKPPPTNKFGEIFFAISSH